ncbi:MULTISPECIES: holo-ACP synthase [Allobacillus]|uniref:Holo-[acyl-carrier-protein] synthase n=1 Tax=Allobacillus halotolerans TaxID=570278 RepID=A0ABS6GV62_9BACI|nr:MULTISPECIES: holo-ACP synthase [Allobacillus]MBU6082012.1 holo-ACP synthase [Allobacillus halotolerans]TSJ66647.1 holo-ACP synthase [Allobacillus sp. SKP2-8]
MIKGIGVDIIELDRIKKIIERKPRFLKRILSDAEMTLYNQLPSSQRKIEFLAGRFAAKEAYSKAEGTGIGELHSFHSIEILRGASGQPLIFKQGKVKGNAHVSISHSKAYAIAQVIIEHPIQ